MEILFILQVNVISNEKVRSQSLHHNNQGDHPLLHRILLI